MQFFKYLFKFSIILVLFCLVGFMLMREYVLAKAAQQLEKSLNGLMVANSSAQTYRKCLELGASTDGSSDSLVTAQLRFINAHEYRLETLCKGFEFSPNLISTESLPDGVSKKAGSSGFVLADGAWSVSLVYNPQLLDGLPLPVFLLDRSKNVLVENKRVVEKLTQDPERDLPVTFCEGYGFACCDQTVSFGEGESRPATNCSDNCFETCIDKPVILAFTALGFDQYSRQLKLSNGQEAQFFFSLGQQGQGSVAVKLDFGDGEAWQGGLDQESVNHIYRCQLGPCQYQAKISLTDGNGVKSDDNNLSVISVVVE